MIGTTNILLRHGCIAIPTSDSGDTVSVETIGTLLMNLSYYGYALSQECYEAVAKLSETQAVAWWQDAIHRVTALGSRPLPRVGEPQG